MRLRSNNTMITKIWLSHKNTWFIEFVFNDEDIYNRHYIYVHAASEEDARRRFNKD